MQLHSFGCTRCSLGFQKNINGCCVSRGSYNTNKMIVGEGPGKEEDSRRSPFTGPAGQLMDKIWASVGLNTNDFYITNVVKCRPVAPDNVKKENLTPKKEQIKQCSQYLDIELELLNPDLIVPVGRIATETILGPIKSMAAVRGKPFIIEDMIEPNHTVYVFPMYHPAAMLHASWNPDKYEFYRQAFWEDINSLKVLIGKIEGDK